MDTVRADTFYQLGEARADALTPWLDEGLVFTQAHSTAPWTVPSIASVFTGLSVPHHGAGTFEGMYGLLRKAPPGQLRGTATTMAEVLSEQANFATTVVSASAWTSLAGMTLGLVRGFDEVSRHAMSGMETSWQPLLDDWRARLRENTNGSRHYHYVHLMEAHNWHMASLEGIATMLDTMPAPERDIYRDIAPAGICEDETFYLCRMFQVYASAVRAERQAIAEVLDTLHEENLLNDTLVVVFSDHGEEFRDHADDGRDLSFGHPYTHYLGHGRTLYQEQLHVPLLIWLPGAAGATIEAPVSLLDIAPTVLNWLGIEFVAEDWEGEKLDDYLEDPAAHADRVLYATGMSKGPQQVSARQGAHKSIWNLVTDHTQYFDLVTDPLELDPEPTDALVMKFDGHFVDFVQNVPKVTVEPGVLSDEQVRHLQSIGYLQGVETE
tara:strand:- start:3373 stop:4686 length:1314 start_codon:yes stop_codon:yes gene_type:complete